MATLTPPSTPLSAQQNASLHAARQQSLRKSTTADSPAAKVGATAAAKAGEASVAPAKTSLLNRVSTVLLSFASTVAKGISFVAQSIFKPLQRACEAAKGFAFSVRTQIQDYFAKKPASEAHEETLEAAQAPSATSSSHVAGSGEVAASAPASF